MSEKVGSNVNVVHHPLSYLMMQILMKFGYFEYLETEEVTCRDTISTIACKSPSESIRIDDDKVKQLQKKLHKMSKHQPFSMEQTTIQKLICNLYCVSHLILAM